MGGEREIEKLVLGARVGSYVGLLVSWVDVLDLGFRSLLVLLGHEVHAVL